MAKSKGPKYYAVAVGRVPGVYSTWEECKAQTFGYSCAIFKSFSTRGAAHEFLIANSAAAAAAAPSNVDIASSLSGLATHERRKRSREDEEEDVASSSAASRQNKKATSSKDVLLITIHFDGGSRGNPGLAGAGAKVVVTNNNSTTDDPITTTYLIREYCGENATNNYAEYKGLLAGLRQAVALLDINVLESRGRLRLQVYGDSNLIIQQLRGTWQCKHPNLLPLYEQSQRLISGIKQYASQQSCDLRCDISFDHVYREHNKVADTLANEAMDQRKSWTTTVCGDAAGDPNPISNDHDGLLNKSTKSSPVEQEREHRKDDVSGVINVDDSDEESYHYC